MKRGLLTLALAAVIFTGDTYKRGNLFEKIARDNYFRIGDYKEYFLKRFDDHFHDIMYLYYDLNKNGKSDLIVLTNILERKGSESLLESYAFVVRTDENEDDLYDVYYFDRDGDGMFEEVNPNPEKGNTPKDKKELFV